MKNSTALRLNRIFPAALIGASLFINDPASAQSGNKYATGLNSLTATDGLGSYNYEGLNFYTNAVKRGAFTKDGEFEALYKAHFYADLKCDSIIKSWKAQTDNLRVFGNAVIDSTLQAQRLEADALSIAGNANITDTLNIGLLTLTGNRISSSNGTISFNGNDLVKAGTLISSTVDAQTYLLSGTAIDFNAMDSTDKALQVQIDSIETAVGNITSSQWQNTGQNSISYTGNATVNGTFQANNINTALLTISDKFTAPKGEFDTLRAERQLSINHNLKLGRDSGSITESDIASKIDVLKIQSDPNVSFDVVMAEGNEAKIGIGVKEGLTAKLNVLGGTRLNDDLQVTGNSTFNGNISSQGTIEANTINASNINLNGTPFSGQFLRLSGDTMKGNITFDNNSSLSHSTSNGLLRFNNPQGENIIGLGYNMDDPATQQGFLIAPSGYKGNPNGSFAFGDANPNGQIILALGTGQSGTRINLDGAGKRLILQNDGGDKFSMGGVNAPTLLETTQGINVSPRSGFAFTGTHLLDIQGSVNAQQYYINGNPIDVAGIDSTLDTLQSIVNNFQSSQWQNTGDGMITYAGSAVINGNLQSASVSTGQLTISDKFTAPKAEADTIHATKSLEVNNSLRLTRDTTVMYAEMSTKDTAVALMLQKDASSPVVIGEAAPPPPGESRPKLTVSGNTKLDGALNVTGNVTTASNINANCITATCLNVNGQTSFDNIQVTTNVKTNRITPLDGDSLIHLGNNSVIINDSWNNLYGSNTNNSYFGNIRGIGLGDFPIAKAVSSVALGAFTMVESNATGSVVIGQGIGFPNPQFLNNNKPNSLMIGFGSNIPTLFIGPSNGVGTVGRVGIRTGSNSPKTDVDIRGHLNIQNGNNAAVIYFPNTGGSFPNLYFRSDDDPDTYEPESERMIIKGTGEVGIGVSNPAEKLEVNGNLRIFDSYDLLLRNSHHGLGWYGDRGDWEQNLTDKRFADKSIDGPVLYGWSGGALGIKRIEYDESLYQDVEIERIALRWDDRGWVGVGTTTPQAQLHVKGRTIIGDNNIISGNHTDYKLAVDGKLVAREFYTISSGWGDHVFGGDYDLWTLQKVDDYLKKFGHLNGFPNAEHFKQNGMNLSEVTILQQIKLEEIFLYLIQQDKKIEELQLKIKSLEEKSK